MVILDDATMNRLHNIAKRIQSKVPQLPHNEGGEKDTDSSEIQAQDEESHEGEGQDSARMNVGLGERFVP